MNTTMLYKKLLIKSKVGYYDGRSWRITLDKHNVVVKALAVPDETFNILIVARSHYQEKLSTYPVDNRQELKKMLALNTNASNCYIINRMLEGSSTVNEWCFNQELPKALFIFPESWLIAQTINDDSTLRVDNKQTYFLHRGKSGMFSSLKTHLLASSDIFKQAIGVPNSIAEEHSSISDYNELLLKGLSKVHLSHWNRFFINTAININHKEFKNIGFGLLTAVALYFSTTTAYLLLEEKSLTAKINKNQQEVNDALKVQNSYDDMQINLRKYETLINDTNHIEIVWKILHEVFNKTHITRLAYVDNRIVLIGDTIRATDILQHLIEAEFVLDAKFDVPVRKYRQRENFTISFALNKTEIASLLRKEN